MDLIPIQLDQNIIQKLDRQSKWMILLVNVIFFMVPAVSFCHHRLLYVLFSLKFIIIWRQLIREEKFHFEETRKRIDEYHIEEYDNIKRFYKETEKKLATIGSRLEQLTTNENSGEITELSSRNEINKKDKKPDIFIDLWLWIKIILSLYKMVYRQKQETGQNLAISFG